MKLDTLPVQYNPYKELEIATNRLVGGIALFSINGFIPLLIGKGDTPEVWISIPADSSGEVWQPLVRRNRSLHEKVVVNLSNKSLSVSTPDGIVLKLHEEQPDFVVIDSLDLRPFGINVFSDKKSMHVINQIMSGNVFIGSKIMVDIGKENA